jgi:diphosphomevalonate decarboxylase
MTTSRTATATAHPNIAFAKYWGKRPGIGNYPAVPSLSVTLAGMATRTTVTFREEPGADRLVLNGKETVGEPLVRATGLLDRVREAYGARQGGASLGAALVESQNDFPTASGLASSASGFGALALAAVGAAGLDWTEARISDLARRSSASAARSLFGGFVELDAGPLAPTGSEELGARVVAPADYIDMAVLVCVTSEEQKSVGSTDGMKTTAEKSPFYAPWVAEAPKMQQQLKAALLRRDFDAMGELTEASTFAMHASAFAAGVIYARGATLDVLAQVRQARRGGLGVYATMDAGPHVKVLVRGDDLTKAMDLFRQVPGVLRVITARPGPGARLEVHG